MPKDAEAMVKTAIQDLKDPKNQNRWIVGGPPDVPESSSSHSKQIQVAFVNNPNREDFMKLQVEHYHTPPIEEYFLMLQGTLKVKIEDATVTLAPMQLLMIPPKKRHTIIDYTPPLQYFLIRAPISTTKTKVVTK